MPDISTIITPDGQTRAIKDSTARSNIKMVYDANGVKNMFNFDAWKVVGMNRGTKDILGNKSIKITATAADCSTAYDAGIYPSGAEIPVTPGETIVFTWSYTPHSGQAAGDDKVFIFWDGVSSAYIQAAATTGIISQIVPAGKTFVTFRLGVSTKDNSATYSNLMFCHADEYNLSNEYKDYSLPNTALTAGMVETYDRICSKNLIDISKKQISTLNGGTWDGNVFTPSGVTGITLTINADGSITTYGTPSTGTFIMLTHPTNLTVGETYVLSGCTGGSASTYGLYSGVQGVWDNFDGGTEKVYDSSIDTIYLYIRASVNVTGKVFKPMICTKADWDISHDFVPYNTLDGITLPVAVKELKDNGGLKNLLYYNLSSLQKMNGSPYGITWNGNVATSTRGVSFTVNDDMSISVTVGGTVTDEVWFYLGKVDYKPDTKYIISGCPSGGSSSTYYFESDNLNVRDFGDTALVSLPTVTTEFTDALYIVIKTGASNLQLEYKPMVCTETAWNISHTYQPYVMENTEMTNFSYNTYGGSIPGKNKCMDNNLQIPANGHTCVAQVCDITGEVVLSVGNISSNDTDSNACLCYIHDLSGTILATQQFSRGDNRAWTTTLSGTARYITFYASQGWSAGDNDSASFTNIMLCSKAEYDKDPSYKPFTLSNVSVSPALIDQVNNGDKNILDLTYFTTGEVQGITVTNNYDGTLTIDGTAAGNPATYITLVTITPDTGDYVISCFNASNTNFYIYDDTPWASSYTNVKHFDGYTTRTIYLRISKDTVIDKITIYPMICKKELWDISHKWVPYRKINADNTALIDIIDGGMKNLCPKNTDSSSTAAAFTDKFYMELKPGNYILAFNSNISASASFNLYNAAGTSIVKTLNVSAGNAYKVIPFTITEKTYWGAFYYNGNSNTLTNIMICTRNAWDISHAYVPYGARNNETIISNLTNTIIDGITSGTYVSSLTETIADIAAGSWVVLRAYNLNQSSGSSLRLIQILEDAYGTRKTRLYYNGAWQSWA